MNFNDIIKTISTRLDNPSYTYDILERTTKRTATWR